MGGSPQGVGIVESIRHEEGTTVRYQTVACSEPGCCSKLEVRVGGSHKPPDVIYNMARRRGWTVNPKKAQFTCPEVHMVPERIEMTRAAVKTSPTETPPREMTKDQRRAIWREIDGHYEDQNNRYITGTTDKSIGEKLSLPWAWVAEVREADFGPAGPDPAVTEIEATLKALTERASKLETDGLAAFEKVEREADAIRAEIARVEAKFKALAR